MFRADVEAAGMAYRDEALEALCALAPAAAAARATGTDDILLGAKWTWRRRWTVEGQCGTIRKWCDPSEFR